jgi:hypothetical protein
VAVAVTAMLSEFSSVVAATFKLPAERMPASPASMAPWGDEVNVAGHPACESSENADAAAGRESGEIVLHVGKLHPRSVIGNRENREMGMRYAIEPTRRLVERRILPNCLFSHFKRFSRSIQSRF